MERLVLDSFLRDLLSVYLDDASYVIPGEHMLGIDATVRIIEMYRNLCGCSQVDPGTHAAADKSMDAFQRDWQRTGVLSRKQFEDFLCSGASKHVHLARYCITQFRVTVYKTNRSL